MYKRQGKVTVVDHDEPIRAKYDGEGGFELGTSTDQLGKLRPAFDPEGIVTAGNAPDLKQGIAGLCKGGGEAVTLAIELEA